MWNILFILSELIVAISYFFTEKFENVTIFSQNFTYFSIFIFDVAANHCPTVHYFFLFRLDIY